MRSPAVRRKIRSDWSVDSVVAAGQMHLVQGQWVPAAESLYFDFGGRKLAEIRLNTLIRRKSHYPWTKDGGQVTSMCRSPAWAPT